VSDLDSINHVGIVVRDMDATASRFEAMGFQLTPYSPHAGAFTPGETAKPFGSGNRCIMFANNYLEILASEDPANPSPRLTGYLEHHEGAHILCFNADRLADVDRRLAVAGVATSGVIPLERTIDTAEGPRLARFERVQFAPGATPEGYVQAATHLTPEYIYQPRHTVHENGCDELSEAVVVTDDLDAMSAAYARYIGSDGQRDAYSTVFQLPRLSRLTLLDRRAANDRLPHSQLPPVPGIAAVTFRTRDLIALRERLERNGAGPATVGERIMVVAERASGVAFLFEDAP
jgi:catechol 2,3-dioxygenase-like lactoylglutathione lyase family enzyme